MHAQNMPTVGRTSTIMSYGKGISSLLCAGIDDAEVTRLSVAPEAVAVAPTHINRAASNRPAPAGSVKMLDMFLRKVCSQNIMCSL